LNSKGKTKMALTDPTPTPAPAAAPDAAPAVNAPAPSVDFSGLSAPGASVVAGQPAPSVAGTSDYGSAMQTAQTATQNAAKLAQPEPPPPPQPHARLLAMVQGLSQGLSAASASLATHGREGGAAQVLQMQGEEQRQKEEAQQAATAQKNAKIQQQLMIADTNQKLANQILFMATIPDVMTKSHLEVTGEEQKQAGEAQTQAIQGADFQAAHGGMKPAEFSAALSSTQPLSPTPNKFFTTNAQQQLGAATKVLGSNDPFVQNLQTVLSNPKSTAGDVHFATQQLAAQQKMQSTATDEQIKKQTAEAGQRPKDLNDATGRVAQARQAYKTTPSPDTKSALDAAKDAQTEFINLDRQQKQIAQDVQNGDPNVIGAALANGTVAPSQVQSARSMSKPFYSKVLQAANAQAKANGAPEILGPNGRHTGQYFNEATAEAQYQYSKSPSTQNTLNKILTLNEPGGDLDILKDAIGALPKMDSKTLNKIFNASATEFGSPEATNYHMALYNLAGLMAQVQTGGIPTQGEIQEQLNLMSAANSKGQLDGALQIARRDISARGQSMVANNPYLRAAYPTLTQVAPTTHVFNATAWAAANPGKDVKAAIAQAKAAGYQVKQ
jgi:hypothetical protein